MEGMNISFEPMAMGLFPATQNVSEVNPEVGFAQTLQDAVDVGAAIPAYSEQTVQSVEPQRSPQDIVPQESVQTSEAAPTVAVEVQPQENVDVQPEQQIQSQSYVSTVEIPLQDDLPLQEAVEDDVEKSGKIAFTVDSPPQFDSSQTDTELMKELADLLSNTEKMLSTPQRMQEKLNDLITQAFHELNDPKAQEEEFTEMVLDFLMKFIDKTFGGEREETSIFQENHSDNIDETDVQDVLLQAVVQMLNNIRSDNEETSVTEDPEEDTEAVDSISATDDISKEYINTTPNQLLGVSYEFEEQTETRFEINAENPVYPEKNTGVQPETDVYAPQQTENTAESTNIKETVRYIPREAIMVEAEKPVEAVERAELVKAVEIGETVEAVAIAQPVKAEKPVEAVVQPTETVKPVEAAVQPTETVRTVEAAVQPTETAKPVEAAVQPTETVRTVEAAAQPTETVRTVEAAAQPTEAVKPVESAVQSVERAQPVEAAVQPTEATKPVETVQTVPVNKPMEAVKTVETANSVEEVEPVLYQAAAQAAESIYNAIVQTAQPQKPADEQVQPVKTERTREVSPVIARLQPADELEELTRLVKGGDTVKSEQPQLNFGSSRQAEVQPVKPEVKLEETGEAIPFEAAIVKSIPQITLTTAFEDSENGAAQIVTQIVSEIFNQLPENGGTTTFVMTLNPETLGKVTVKLVEEAGKISVTVTAHNKHTAEILSARVDNLQAAMKENGTELEKYQVVYEPEQSEHSGQQSFDGSSKNPYVKQQEEEDSDSNGEFAELLQQAV